MTFAILLAVSTAFTIGCSGSGSNNTPGARGGWGGGTTGGGGTAGTGGPTGGGGSGGGGIGVHGRCSRATPRANTSRRGTTIAFGGADPGFDYAPKCLKVPAGTTVTFIGDFAMPPARPVRDARTADRQPDPITVINAGTTVSFTFPTAGFYAYYCMFHGSDDGEFMSGVIWVDSRGRGAPALSRS